MKTYSALVTCFTEVLVTVEAENAKAARRAIKSGQVSTARLYDALPVDERLHDITIEPGSFGEDC